VGVGAGGQREKERDRDRQRSSSYIEDISGFIYFAYISTFPTYLIYSWLTQRHCLSMYLCLCNIYYINIYIIYKHIYKYSEASVRIGR